MAKLLLLSAVTVVAVGLLLLYCPTVQCKTVAGIHPVLDTSSAEGGYTGLRSAAQEFLSLDKKSSRTRPKAKGRKRKKKKKRPNGK